MSVFAKSNLNGWRAVLTALLLSASFISVAADVQTVQAGPFTSDYFRRAWAPADYPVVIGAAKRGFVWGSEPFFSSFETYEESPNGQRQVEYFDKARMEISRPDYDVNDDYYVTNGLIVKEMVTGLLQTGEFRFKQRLPAYDVPLAGDPIANPEAVTYASFYALGSVPGSYGGAAGYMSRQADRLNERAAETINRGGNVGRNELLGALEGVDYVYYERTLGHNVPRVFFNYLNQTGPVYSRFSNSIINANVYNWISTFGYPVTDAFWTKANVAGVARDVLVQLYERRILTYTPSNPDGFKIEMGNVGRHYYGWRYSQNYDISLPTQSNAEVRPEAVFPGAQIVIHAFRFADGEDVSVTLLTPNGKPFIGRTLFGDIEVNQSGFFFFPIYLITTSLTVPGQYTVYFKGTRTGNEAKAYFFIIGIPGFNLPPR